MGTQSVETEILLVEDAKFYRTVLKNQIESQLGFKVHAAETFAQAEQILKDRGDDLFLALLDLNLPDAPNGEIVDHVLKSSIPSIVFSGFFNEEIRDDLMQKRIIDYVLKDSPASIDYVVATTKRVYDNQSLKVLIIDDSKTARFQLHELLDRYRFKVLEATNGKEGLQTLLDNPDVSLVITDYNMPEMDGFDLTRKIRAHFSKRQLPIIGISTYGNHSLSAKFLKAGANDFLTKPFLNEEFFCRVTQNIEMVDYIHALKNSMNTDYLTGLNNRGYFYKQSENLMKKAHEENLYLACALIDVDHFKAINENFSHDAGDETLIHLATKLRHRFTDEGLVCRFDGEQFCVLLAHDDPQDFPTIFEAFRLDIAESAIEFSGHRFSITISIGLSWSTNDDLNSLLTNAEDLLKTAKESGRNKVIS